MNDAVEKTTDNALATDPAGPATEDAQAETEQRPVTVMPEKKRDKVQPLASNALQLAESAYNSFNVDVRSGVTAADLEDQAFWTHHGFALKPRDEIRACAEDGSFVAYLLVVNTGPKAAKVVIKQFIELDKFDPKELQIPHGYGSDWAGSISKWRVTRDTEILKGGFDPESQAIRWVHNHLEALRR